MKHAIKLLLILQIAIGGPTFAFGPDVLVCPPLDHICEIDITGHPELKFK